MINLTKKLAKIMVIGLLISLQTNQATPMSQQLVQPRISQAQLNQIVREVMKDRSPGFAKKFFKEIAFITGSLVLGVVTAAIINQDLFDQFRRAIMSENETIMNVFARWNGGKIIKPVSILLLSSIGYYVLFTLIFDYLLAPKDNKKENIQALAHLLETAQKQQQLVK